MEEAEIVTTETYDNLNVGDFYEKLTTYRDALNGTEESDSTSDTQDTSGSDTQTQGETSDTQADANTQEGDADTGTTEGEADRRHRGGRLRRQCRQRRHRRHHHRISYHLPLTAAGPWHRARRRSVCRQEIFSGSWQEVTESCPGPSLS